MIYRDALEYLGRARRFGMKLGLEPMRELARALGDPQEKLRFIHLAGTNGKGSTAAFCESCLRAAGFRVGLYTSPHLVSVRERFQIDRVPISESDFAEGMAAVRRALDAGVSGKTPPSHDGGYGDWGHEATFFELTTALALWYFAREKVDWVVWETGLGGRLDATNIVMPEVCIITNIGLEHQQYLGQTLAEIAAEKAGIIKPGVPVVTAVEKGEAGNIIRDQMEKNFKNGPGTLIKWTEELENLGIRDGKQWARMSGNHPERESSLGLLGAHQIENAACAIAAMDHINWGHAAKIFPPHHPGITEEAIARGLAETVWPGRFEILSENPLIVLDGAHNPAGTKMLVQTWREFLAARFGWSAQEIEARARLVFASVTDKDITEMAALLSPLAREVSLVRLAHERGADPQSLAPFFAGLPCTCYDSVAEVCESVETAAPESITLVTGSLFLVGEMLARRAGSAEEYRLNERLEKLTGIR